MSTLKGAHARLPGDALLDGLAPVGVGAMPRVRGDGSLGCLAELVPGAVQGLDLSLDLDEMPFQQVRHMVTRRLPLITHLEYRHDLGEGETGALGVPDEPETVHRLVAVVAVPVGRPRRGASSPICS
jgi:hypothetical protein